MKAVHVLLFVMLYKVVLFLASVVKVVSAAIQMKATGQFFPVKLFNLLRYKLAILLGYVDKISKCDHSNQ